MSNRANTEQWQNEMLGDLRPNIITASGATYVHDVTVVETAVVTLTANCTVGAPINTNQIRAGNRTCLIFVQDSTGGRTLAWNAAWRNAPALAAGTAGQRACFEFRWDGVNMQLVGGAVAFA